VVLGQPPTEQLSIRLGKASAEKANKLKQINSRLK